MNWYILKVAKGQDNKVKSAIDNIVESNNLQKYVLEIITPTETYYEVKKGKRIKKERSMLAGYLLVRADLKELVLNAILSVNGALGFMGEARHKPEIVRDREIDRMIGRMITSNETPTDLWIAGENVKIVSGPFSSFNATIKSVEAQKRKLNVEVKIFGRPTDVELDYASVEKS